LVLQPATNVRSSAAAAVLASAFMT
jgi:hypothetical protein